MVIILILSCKTLVLVFYPYFHLVMEWTSSLGLLEANFSDQFNGYWRRWRRRKKKWSIKIIIRTSWCKLHHDLQGWSKGKSSRQREGYAFLPAFFFMFSVLCNWSLASSVITVYIYVFFFIIFIFMLSYFVNATLIYWIEEHITQLS